MKSNFHQHLTYTTRPYHFTWYPKWICGTYDVIEHIRVGFVVVKMSLCEYSGTPLPNTTLAAPSNHLSQLQERIGLPISLVGVPNSSRYLASRIYTFLLSLPQRRINTPRPSGSYQTVRWLMDRILYMYFRFHLSVSFHHCSILIHSSTIHAVRCFSPSTSVFPCQNHSTIPPYSFIHLPPTLYNIFLPALQFSPISIIPPLLHTHSFIYHPRCIMFSFQYFSFPLPVSFHHCSILIHSSAIHAA